MTTAADASVRASHRKRHPAVPLSGRQRAQSRPPPTRQCRRTWGRKPTSPQAAAATTATTSMRTAGRLESVVPMPATVRSPARGLGTAVMTGTPSTSGGGTPRARPRRARWPNPIGRMAVAPSTSARITNRRVDGPKRLAVARQSDSETVDPHQRHDAHPRGRTADHRGLRDEVTTAAIQLDAGQAVEAGGVRRGFPAVPGRR